MTIKGKILDKVEEVKEKKYQLFLCSPPDSPLRIVLMAQEPVPYPYVPETDQYLVKCTTLWSNDGRRVGQRGTWALTERLGVVPFTGTLQLTEEN